MPPKPCEECDEAFEGGGILMSRNELWEAGWHTHKQSSTSGYLVFKDEFVVVDDEN